MKRVLLADFSKDEKISVRTLKKKYRDCILYEGRQSFIDTEKFEKVFRERSRRGIRVKGSVEKFMSIKQVDFQIKNVDKQLEKAKKALTFLMLKAKASGDTDSKIEFLVQKREVKKLEDRRKNLKFRRDVLYKRLKDELSEYDEDGILKEEDSTSGEA